MISLTNPSMFGQSVTFTATVAWNGINSVLPTGTVTFEEGGVPLSNGTIPLNSVGTATFTDSSLTVGSDTITASYSGDANSTSSCGTLSGGQTVNKASTTTSLTLFAGAGSYEDGSPGSPALASRDSRGAVIGTGPSLLLRRTRYRDVQEARGQCRQGTRG